MEKYIDHVHVLENGKPAKVIDKLNYEILINFKRLLNMKRQGVNLFFTNIDKIKEIIMKEELETVK